jgi:hypothetical protein
MTHKILLIQYIISIATASRRMFLFIKIWYIRIYI